MFSAVSRCEAQLSEGYFVGLHCLSKRHPTAKTFIRLAYDKNIAPLHTVLGELAIFVASHLKCETIKNIIARSAYFAIE